MVGYRPIFRVTVPGFSPPALFQSESKSPTPVSSQASSAGESLLGEPPRAFSLKCSGFRVPTSTKHWNGCDATYLSAICASERFFRPASSSARSPKHYKIDHTKQPNRNHIESANTPCFCRHVELSRSRGSSLDDIRNPRDGMGWAARVVVDVVSTRER